MIRKNSGNSIEKGGLSPSSSSSVDSSDSFRRKPSPPALAFGKHIPKEAENASSESAVKKSPVVKTLRGGKGYRDESFKSSTTTTTIFKEAEVQTVTSIDIGMEIEFISRKELFEMKSDRDDLENIISDSMNTVTLLKEKVSISNQTEQYTVHMYFFFDTHLL